ncbi:MAG: hypothetical protein QXD13_01980 [Candidatus Pacearchaeota archaeon]
MENEGLRKYLAEVRAFKDKLGDNTLSTLSGHGRGDKFKCRREWAHTIVNYLFQGLLERYLTEDSLSIREYAEFCKYMDDTNFREREITTQEDIKRGNQLLTAIINEVEALI